MQKGLVRSTSAELMMYPVPRVLGQEHLEEDALCDRGSTQKHCCSLQPSRSILTSFLA